MYDVVALGGFLFIVRKLVAVATSAVADASVARSRSVAAASAAVSGSIVAASVAATVAGVSTADIGEHTAQRNSQKHRKAMKLNWKRNVKYF